MSVIYFIPVPDKKHRMIMRKLHNLKNDLNYILHEDEKFYIKKLNYVIGNLKHYALCKIVNNPAMEHNDRREKKRMKGLL